MFLQNAETSNLGDRSIDFKDFTLPKHLLPASIFDIFSCFFRNPSRNDFLLICWRFLSKKCDFGPPWRRKGVPKSAPGPLRDPPERVGIVCSIAVPLPLLHPCLSVDYLQLSCDNSRAKRGGYRTPLDPKEVPKSHFFGHLGPKTTLFWTPFF